MNIMIKKGEYIFSSQGTHVCNELGMAIRAEVDAEYEIEDEHFQRVRDLVTADRLHRGLDANGDIIPVEQSENIEQ